MKQPTEMSPGDGYVDGVLTKASAEKKVLQEREKAEIGVAKARNPEKELFDITLFSQIYDLRSDDGDLRLDEDRVHDLEVLYYLEATKTRTLSEFSDWLDKYESRIGN